MFKKIDEFPQIWLCLGLGMLILVFYWNSFSAGLVFDSNTLIRQDPRLRAVSWVNIEQILTHNYWWPSREGNLYRPVTTLSYLLNYSLLGNGTAVWGYHVVNFLLHWGNAWLVLLIVRLLAGRLELAVLAASIFALHPVNTEAVTNVIGRPDLLATASVLFGGWCYLRATIPGARKTWWLVAMGTAACVGVLAKENAVMIVAFVGLYDVLWRLPLIENGKKGLERWKISFNEFVVRGYLALIPALVLLGLIRRWMGQSTVIFEEVFVDNPLVGATPFQSFMTAMGVIGRYMGLLVFPRTLSSDYSFNQIPLYGTAGNGLAEAVPWISLGIVILVLVAAVWLRRRRTLFSWGVLFFFAMLLPTSNLLLTIGSIMAERFLYLPSVGFSAVAALALCRLSEALSTRAVTGGPPAALIRWVLPAVVIIAMGVRTTVRNTDWQSDLSLWTSAVAAAPASFKTHMAYGNAVWSGRFKITASRGSRLSTRLSRKLRSPDPFLNRTRQFRSNGRTTRSIWASGITTAARGSF